MFGKCDFVAEAYRITDDPQTAGQSAMEPAVAIGGAAVMIAGMIAVVLPTGMVLGGGAVLASTPAGAGIGA
jgi:hypothetical protein